MGTALRSKRYARRVALNTLFIWLIHQVSAKFTIHSQAITLLACLYPTSKETLAQAEILRIEVMRECRLKL